MRRPLLAISAFLALLLAPWFLLRDERPAELEGPFGGYVPRAAATSSAELEPLRIAEDATRTQASVAEAAPEPIVESALEGACVVIGRVVDVDRRAGAGATGKVGAGQEWVGRPDTPPRAELGHNPR
jgi:hypothetical protein